MSITTHTITRMLGRIREGDGSAGEELMSLVYDELRSLARGVMHRDRAGSTLQATALVNEAYLRLLGPIQLEWQSRAQFFGLASLAMRQILSNHIRSRRAAKRGGDQVRLTLAEEVAAPEATVSLDVVHDVLEMLAKLDARQSKIVECRFFGGMTNDEIAQFLDVSPSTVDREWRAARAWINAKLRRVRK